MKTKILFLAPHLSTGGMPQFLLKRIETLKKNYDIYVVEYRFVSDTYIVQRNQIQYLLGDNLFTLEQDKTYLFDIIDNVMPDIVHLEHEAEGFDIDIMRKLYSDDRTYKIVETCHNITFDPKSKIFIPDGFAYCSPYHEKTFDHLNVYSELIEYPIVDRSLKKVTDKIKYSDELGLNREKINVLNVGLWTKGKNQAEGIEIARKNPKIDFHFVGNQAINFKDYWQPLMNNLPPNVKVWGERNDVDKFMIACDVFMFNSVHECNPLVLKEAISYGLPIYAHNLPQYCGVYDDFITQDFSQALLKIWGTLTDSVKLNETEYFSKISKIFYTNMKERAVNTQPKKQYKIHNSYIDGAYLSISGNSNSKFKVQFLEPNGNVVYENEITCGSWVKTNRQYYTEYTTKVWEDDELVFEETLSLEGKKVMISFDSSSLGDTLAWMPYCDEFKRKHKCQLFVSTFKNFLFEDEYPNIKFIEPNTRENDLYAKYNLGWYYNPDKEPVLPSTIPLQQTATNILGLEFKEIKPRVAILYDINQRITFNAKHVTIAPDSTAGCKEWSLENWQEVVDYYVDRGYKVVNVSMKSKYKLKNVNILADSSLEFTMRLIRTSEIFIGLSSGLSWLAWSLNTHVVMIANFTERSHEFQTGVSRLTNNNVCNSCWNNKNFKFDKSDWEWCPIWKGYDRQFECQKGITPKSVIKAIDLKLGRHTGKYRKSSN